MLCRDGPAAIWPDPSGCTAQVEFQNVQMRYRDGLPLVLRGLSVTVAPGSRCGVVGRTGAGKSSLINCLFRRGPLPRRMPLCRGWHWLTVQPIYIQISFKEGGLSS